jgi:hypothetical protein
MLVKTKLHKVYNGNFDITRMLDQSNLSVQRCRLIFWVECSVGGYLALAKTISGCTRNCWIMLNGVSHSRFENVVPIIENMIEKCIKTHLRTYFSRSRGFTAARYLTDVKSDVWVIFPAPLDIGKREHSKHL